LSYWLAGWSSLVARWAHNPKVIGSNPIPATFSHSPRFMQSLQSRLTILYTAFLFSSLVYVIVGFALMKTGWKAVVSGQPLQQALFGIFVFMSFGCLAVAFLIKKKQSEPTEKNTFSKSIVLLALSELPAILGLVVFLLSANFVNLLILWLISVAAFILFRPGATSDS
jgi:F0F1-type ATP synthase membrane subunit c/vacuolar-type H+-ATPase subunit K